MKRSTKQLLSMLLAIIMVFGLMAPAMAATPMMGEVAETPVGEAAPAASRSASFVEKIKATLADTTNDTVVYTLEVNGDGADANIATYAASTDIAAGKYGTADFFTLDAGIQLKSVGADETPLGLNLKKNGGNYIGFTITGNDATVEVTFRGASGGENPKTSGGAVYKYDDTTKGDALVDASHDTSAIAGNTVKITATYTNVAPGTYRIEETANNTTVHVISVKVTETNGTAYTACEHPSAAADPKTATQPSCGVPGKEADTMCPDCGKKIATGAAIAALEHNYDDETHVCANCGQTDPNAPTDEDLVGGDWTITAENFTTYFPTEKTDGTGTGITNETVITTDITALTFAVGGALSDAMGTPNKYKLADNTAESMPVALTGGVNCRYTKADNSTANINADNPTPDCGTYFKWTAKSDGTLTVDAIANSGKMPVATVNGDMSKVDEAWNKGANVSTKTRCTFTVNVKKDDVVTFGLGGGSKPQLIGFSFVVSEPEVGGDWTITSENFTTYFPTEKTDGTGTGITNETLVNAGVTGLKFYVGGALSDAMGTPNKYKLADNTAESMPVALTGGVNCRYTKADNSTANINADNPTPDCGTYFKWVIEADGTLTVDAIANSGKMPVAAVNGDMSKVDEAWNKGANVSAKTRCTFTVNVKKDDVVTFGLGGGSKPQLIGFSFTGGGGAMEEKPMTWDKDGAESVAKSVTVTPKITAGSDTITVTVTGIQVGKKVDAANKTIWVGADSLDVVVYDFQGEVVDTVTKNAAGDSHTFTVQPGASGKYTFKAVAKRDGETSNVESDAVAAGDFILPLVVPSINSASSNGLESGKETASATVSWTTVPEASSYNLYVKAHDAADWGTAQVVPATTAANVNATVTGLTVGSEYDFTVEAVRAATTIGGVSIAASTTAKSEVESLEVTANKQIPWTTKVFGTSATASTAQISKETPEISVVDAEGKAVTTAPSNGILEGTVTYDFSRTNKDGDVSSNDHKETIENLTGDLNTDPEGRILLSSRDGAGKITEPNGSDGMLFHYTTVPAGYNFRLKAKVHVARWFTRDTQNGLGLAVLDRVPASSQTGSGSSNAGDYWNNSYMAGAARVGFTYDTLTGKTYGTGSAMSAVTSGDKNYSYYMGLCAILKHGNDKNHPSGAGNAPTSMFDRLPLDTRLPKNDVSVKYNNNNNRFNTIGNYTKLPAGYSVQAEKTEGATNQIMANYELTDFVLQIEKTPTGYVSTAWTVDGTLLGQVVQYYSKGAPELSACDGNSANNPYVHYANAVNAANAVDLSGNVDKGIEIMDPSAEYVGFFTSRDTDAMFSDVEFEMTPQAEDDRPVETPPLTTVTPKVSFVSGTTSNTEDFTLVITTNVKGTVEVRKGNTVVGTVEMSELDATGTARAELDVKLASGNNTFTAKLTVAPEEEQGLPPYTVLDQELPKDATTAVTYSVDFSKLTNIYVSPNANSTGRGTRNSPTDIHSAVAAVQPGQNIIMLAGTYNLLKTIDIGPAMDGTEETPIYMGPEVDENGNPVKVILNGQGRAGTVIKTGADWWVFDNFEVVNSSSGSKGFLVGGSHNVVQNISVHDNGSSGLSVTRYNGNVRIPVRNSPSVPADQVTDWGEWPCDNLILNCTSYRNYDLGYNGADGFEAKEAVGSGNVFDGCVAYWNADDGWDLYAKADADKGCLGVVTLKNCITFQNGYEVRKIIDSQTQTPALQEGSTYLPVMNTDANGNLVLADAGNGNGFKMGGSHMPGAHVISNSYAFMNKAKGFDSNNGPDISVIDCTAYNNGDENVGLSSNSTLAYVVTNVVSFKDDNCLVGNENKPMMADAIKDGSGNKITNHYKWDGEKVTINGTNYTKDDGDKLFESLDFDAKAWWDGAQRSADGSLDLGDFMKLKLADVGAGELVNDTAPVETPDAVVNPPEEGSNDSAVSTGNGGTLSGGADKKDDDNKTDVTPVYTADKSTNVNGDTTITVKDQNGEVVADVKLPATIPAPETKFDDVADDHWAADAINNMAGLGVVNGVGGNLYSTDAAVTRATIATMLWRFANGKAGIDNTFADVADGMWYTDAIGWAAKVGVVTGYSEDAFGPNDTITREQLATMLARFAKLVGLNTEASADALDGYQDKAGVSAWAVDGMAWCVKNGIINGVSADTLSPATSATRAQTALMLDRFIALMK